MSTFTTESILEWIPSKLTTHYQTTADSGYYVSHDSDTTYVWCFVNHEWIVSDARFDNTRLFSIEELRKKEVKICPKCRSKMHLLAAPWFSIDQYACASCMHSETV